MVERKLPVKKLLPDDKATGSEGMARIFAVLQRHWDSRDSGTVRRGKDPSISRVLDETEINGATDESIPQSLSEAQTAVTAYHADWQKVDEITQLTPDGLEEKDMAGLITYLQLTRKLIKRMYRAWGTACRDYWRNKSLAVGSPKDPRAESGVEFYDLDVFFEQPPADRDKLLSSYPELNEIGRRFQIGKMSVLKDRQHILEQVIKNLIAAQPEMARQMIGALDSSDQAIDDQMLDDLLGIKIEEVEQSIDLDQLPNAHLREELWLESSCFHWTSYTIVRMMLRELKLEDVDVLYDLGSGYGRVPIYAALATRARCKGIEIIPERVAESVAVQNRLRIDNVQFIQGNVLEQDYSDGTVFFLFSPFTDRTLGVVIEKLRLLAKTKKIRVVSLGGPSKQTFDHQQDWLKPLGFQGPWGLTIYESIQLL